MHCIPAAEQCCWEMTSYDNRGSTRCNAQWQQISKDVGGYAVSYRSKQKADLALGGGASLKLPTTSASAYHTCTALFALLGEVVLPGGEPEGDVGNWVRSRSTRPKI